MFCFDGKVPKRGFLELLQYYDEIALDDSSLSNRELKDVEFFASSDLMEHAESYPTAPEKPVLLREKLKDIAKIIFGYHISKFPTEKLNLNARDMLKRIDGKFLTFEVKIPGTVQNPNWQSK